MGKYSKDQKLVIIIILTLILAYCNLECKDELSISEKGVYIEGKANERIEKLLSERRKKSDYSSFDYKLTNSNYIFKIKISNIEILQVKNVFEVKTDQYSIPIKKDGYSISIKYLITNPYFKEMNIPIPEHYEITSLNDEDFSTNSNPGQRYDRSCECRKDISNSIIDNQGRELWEISNKACGFSDKCILFKPNETKVFTIIFDNPIMSNINQLVFIGFNRTFYNPNRKNPSDIGLIIDVKKAKIIGEKRFLE